ncbi:hypothetical protein LCGC14_2017870 [marine sediment metagenome]|uniref:DUF1565 domain-containing protein n=1 Tax=marine sediment metagenome TaxID=412755 RepID=A0A0F9HBQ3_9ZZZZ
MTLWKCSSPRQKELRTSSLAHLQYLQSTNLPHIGIWYVSTLGSDSNDGSPQNQVLTIDFAISLASPGDVIVLGQGAHSDNFTIDKSISITSLSHYGSSFFSKIDATLITIDGAIKIRLSNLYFNPGEVKTGDAGNVEIHAENCHLQPGILGSGLQLERLVLRGCELNLPDVNFVAGCQFLIYGGNGSITQLTMAGVATISINHISLFVSGSWVSTSATTFSINNAFLGITVNFDLGTNAMNVFNSVIDVGGVYTHGTITALLQTEKELNEWYVKKSGSDAAGIGDGSQGTPYLTISKAITAASANDVIYIGSGIFVESLAVSKTLTIIGVGRETDQSSPWSKIDSTITFTNNADLVLRNIYALSN